MSMHAVLVRTSLVAVLMLAGCGPAGDGDGNTNDNDNANANTNDNGNVSTPLAACERYIAYLAGLPCLDPDFPTPSCVGVDQVPAEQLPDYDCLIENVLCADDGTVDDSGTPACLP